MLTSKINENYEKPGALVIEQKDSISYGHVLSLFETCVRDPKRLNLIEEALSGDCSIEVMITTESAPSFLANFMGATLL